jgi:hypothetical protein
MLADESEIPPMIASSLADFGTLPNALADPGLSSSKVVTIAEQGQQRERAGGQWEFRIHRVIIVAAASRYFSRT